MSFKEKLERNKIPKEDLITGVLYHGFGRNFNEAFWNGKVFLGMRQKFHDIFMDMEEYWDDTSGTFVPLCPIKALDINKFLEEK